MKYKDIIEKMTIEEKAMLCVGKDLWNTNEIKRLNIPSIHMADGPHGLRIEVKDDGPQDEHTSKKSICFPAEATIASSWDKELAYQVGKTIGKEASHEGIDILLGPGVNIKRSPLGGRNFEYFSEDPYLSGKMGANYVKGLQESGVSACVKHFTANNQETSRMSINVVIDERTLREIYLTAFEIVVKEAKPISIMSAYSKINGIYCSENKKILDILKEEWNSNGIVITDWGAENDRVDALKAGNEIEMPGTRKNIVQQIVNAVKNHKIEESILDELVDRILTVVFTLTKRKAVEEWNREKDHQIALKAAEGSIVLLKNTNNILPIQRQKIAVIGDMATYPRYQGGGSSNVNSYKIETAYNCFKEENIEFEFAQGYERIESENKNKLLQEAIEVAKNNKTVLLFVGLTENEEAEGRDRISLNLPKNQNELIEEITKVNSNVVIVLSHGSPISMPWKDKVKAIITGYLGGEAGAKAMLNCLLGLVNPSGKLAETYPIKIEDTPCYKNFPGNDLSVEYQESIYVGYRYYDTIKKEVLFPFGFGLSYTNFDYSNLQIKQENTNIEISVNVKNVGKVIGKEIVQIYISQENSTIFKPNKELKGFEKIELKPGEEKIVQILLDETSFRYYNVETKRWAIEEGKYNILIGSSSDNILLKSSIEIKSNDAKTTKIYPEVYKTGHIENVKDTDFESLLDEPIPQRYIDTKDATEQNSIIQIKNTKVGKYIYNKEMQIIEKYLENQDIEGATRVTKYLQMPLKRLYEVEISKISKKMVDEFINIIKKDQEVYDCDFIKIYFETFGI